MKKTMRKVLAIILCITMMAGTLCVAASAESATPPYKYVHVGDSASMGYQMNDYFDHVQHNVNNLTGEPIEASSQYSIYSQMVKYLQDKGVDVAGTDLSMTGMRTLEFRSLLDKNYYENHKTEIYDDASVTTFWGYHMYDYLFNYWKHGYAYGPGTTEADKITDKTPSVEQLDAAYTNINGVYTEKLSDADLITIDLTMNDFGTYFGSRFIDMNGEPYVNDTFAKIMAEGNYPEVAKAAETLRVSLEKLLANSGIPMETVDQYIDAILYSFASLCINFSTFMDLIYTNNPDVEIIVVGPFNVMEGLTFTVGELPLDVELIWGALNEAITGYICAVDPHRSQYKFADLSGKSVETCTAIVARNELDLYDEVRSLYYGGAGLNVNALLTYFPESVIQANLAKAAQFTTVPLTEVLAAMGDMQNSAVRAMTDFDGEGTTDADRGLLHVALRFAQGYALGSHPSPDGYATKGQAVFAAYENDYAADGTYVARAVETAWTFGAALVNAILGDKDALAALKQMILDLFAPIMKVFDLITSFGK